jgi:hypothetical protein
MAGFDNETVYGSNVDFTGNATVSPTVTTNGQLLIGSTATPNIQVGVLNSPDSSITFGYSSPNITAIVNRSVVQDLHTAKWIVNQTPNSGGNVTSIASALASASSGETIFVMPGTYTENLTLKAGVNLTTYGGESNFGQVTIVGTVTASFSGSATITGIRLQTNGATALSVTGASALDLVDCNINATNATGITINNASSIVNLWRCKSLVTATFTLFTATAVGSLTFSSCYMNNSSTAVSNVVAGVVMIYNSYMEGTYSTTSTGLLDIRNSFINVTAATAITTAGNQTSFIMNSTIASTTGSSVSIGTGTTVIMTNSAVSSSNANAITGLGTLQYGGLIFYGSSSTVNTSTQTKLVEGPIISTTGLTFDGGTNVMAAYTVGTFTPTMVGGTVAGTTTYTNQNGYYVRVGAVVTIQATVTGSAATGTGNATLGAFPFTIKNQTNGNAIGALIMANNASWTWPASTTYMQVFAGTNGTIAQMLGSGSAGATGNLQMANAAFNFQYTLTYEI